MDINGQNLTKKQRRELKKQEKLESKQREQNKKKRTQILVWVGIVILLGAGVYGLMQVESDGANKKIQIDAIDPASDNTKGNPDADVVLIEYSDFQCPACASYRPILSDFMDEYGDKVHLAFRHFPLSSIHPNAQVAGQAAQAAAIQDKFWEMHDKLFDNQSDWSNLSDPSEKFAAYAEELGLDVEKFNTDLGSETVKNKVNDDYDSATAAGLNSTPSFILNGEKIDNPRSVEDLKELVDQQLGVETDAMDEESAETTEPEGATETTTE